MTILLALISLFSLLSGFDTPIFKDSIKDKAAQLEVCANGGCVR